MTGPSGRNAGASSGPVFVFNGGRAMLAGAGTTHSASLRSAGHISAERWGDRCPRELRRLTQEGYLRMEGERRGARYVPGPSLRGAEE